MGRDPFQTLSFALCVTALSAVSLGQDSKASATRASVKESRKATNTRDEPEGLQLLVGQWSVVETHFDRSGKVVATSKGQEKNKWVLDRSVVERNYRSPAGTPPYHARCMVSYVAAEKKYKGVWFDNLQANAPTLVEGEWNDDKQVMIWTMESFAEDGAKVRHRVVERFLDSETRHATTYRLEGSDVIKAWEFRYTRTIPCPAKIRGMAGD